MEFKLHVPIYLQIMDIVKMDIMLKVKIPGEQLPSVRDLAAQYVVNPNTVQKAYHELEREGLCDSQRGLGRFIIDDPQLAERLKVQYMAKQTSDYFESMGIIGLEPVAVLTYLKEAIR